MLTTPITTADEMSVKKYVHGEPASSAPELKFGWARRPAHGEGKGATYMSDEFATVVEKLFECGEKKKGCKYSPHQMHAELLRRFPDRFDIPSVIEISAAVSNLVQNKNRPSAVSTGASGDRGGRGGRGGRGDRGRGRGHGRGRGQGRGRRGRGR